MEKRIFLAFLTVSLLASSACAFEIIFDPTVDIGTGGASASPFYVEKDGITMSVSNGVANGVHYRFYRGQTVSFASEIGNITQIQFECVASGDAQYGPGCFNVDEGNYIYAENIGLWTGSASSIVFTATTYQVRANKIIVTVNDEGLPPPIITPASGTYFDFVDVIITSSSPNAEIYYTIDGTEPGSSSKRYTTPFTLDCSTTVKAISVYNDKTSMVMSVDYVISYDYTDGMGLGGLREVPDGTYVKAGYDATVIQQGGNYLYLKDDTGYGLIYGKTGQSYSMGDAIEKGYIGMKKIYGGEPEMVYPSNFKPSTRKVGLNPVEITTQELDSEHWAHYVVIKQAVLSTTESVYYSLTDEYGSCVVYNNYFNIDLPTDDTAHDWYGVIGVYQQSYQFLPISVDMPPVQPVSDEYDFIIDGIAYKVIGENTVKVTYTDYSDDNYKGYTCIIVPETITYEGINYQVNSIGDYAFAWCSSLVTLIIPPSINSIASNAFSGISLENLYILGRGDWQAGKIFVDVRNLFIGSSISSICGLQVNPSAIYSFAAIPPTCDDNTFKGYEAVLHVLNTSFTDYFAADYWCNFANIEPDAIEPVSVSLNNNESEMIVGNTLQLSALVSPVEANPNLVIWISSNPMVANVTSNGLVTAVGLGECDIIAIFLDKQAICHVTVIEPTIYITLDLHEASVQPNHMITLSPTMSPFATSLMVTSSDQSIAVARLVNGVIQVAGRAEGTAMIIVSSTDGKAVADTCMVTVYTEPGDVNCDGYINISDVTSLIDYLLSGNPQGLKVDNADTNRDSKVNISDVTTLIDYLLSGHWPDVPVTPTDNHEYVDLGLPSGTLWATMNIGANSPEDFGDYFAWGETEPKDYYDWDTYKWCNGSYTSMTKYCTLSEYGNNGLIDNKTELDPEDDAAYVNWGSLWRMPSKAQIDELNLECTWRWTQRNGVNGLLVTGTNGNSMFLPAAGGRWYELLCDVDNWGFYWSRTLQSGDPYFAFDLYFDSGKVYWDMDGHYAGFTVRAVRVSQN